MGAERIPGAAQPTPEAYDQTAAFNFVEAFENLKRLKARALDDAPILPSEVQKAVATFQDALRDCL